MIIMITAYILDMVAVITNFIQQDKKKLPNTWTVLDMNYWLANTKYCNLSCMVPYFHLFISPPLQMYVIY